MIERVLIKATGPSPADVLLVGEAGGEQEHLRGWAFIGKSGAVLDTYLLKARCPRHTVRVTNLYPFWTGPGNPDPTPLQIQIEAPRLWAEIDACAPRLIVPLGRLAARFFLGDVDMEAVHGIPHYPRGPQWARLTPEEIPLILPAYHPAAGLHSPELAALCFTDLLLIRPVLNGDLTPRGGRAKDLPIGKWLGTWNRPTCNAEIMSTDTEGTKAKPWGLSLAVPSATFVVKANEPLPGKLKARAIVFHNAMYDLGVLEAMKVEVEESAIQDTMVAAYNLGTEPQGLKPLAYRYLGRKRKSYDEVVRPHHNSAALDYLMKALDIAADCPDAEEELVEDPKTGNLKIYKPQSLERRLETIIKGATRAKR